MSADRLFKTAVLHAARVGFDGPGVGLPLFGRTADGERIAVLDGRLSELKERLGFLVLRSPAGEPSDITVSIDRAPVDTTLRSRDNTAILILLGDHQGRFAPGVLELHVDDPNGSAFNGQPVSAEDFREPTSQSATVMAGGLAVAAAA